MQSLPAQAILRPIGCMSKEEAIEVMAKVLETLPNAIFRVELGESRHPGVGAYLWKNAEAFHQNSSG